MLSPFSFVNSLLGADICLNQFKFLFIVFCLWICNIWLMNSTKKELKNYAYYNIQIQQKSAQIVGMVGLDLYLPPISYTNVTGSTSQLNYFDSEVQYLIVDGPHQLSEEIGSKIILNVSKTMRKNLTIEIDKNEAKSNIGNIVLHFEMNQKQATIAVYCLQLKQDRFIRVNSWRKYVDKKILNIVKQVQQAAVCYQFTGLQILQLVFYDNQRIILLSLGTYIFNFLFGQSDSHSKETGLLNEIKNSILFLALKHQINLKTSQPICIKPQHNRFTDCYKKQFWIGKALFLYFCQKELNITIKQYCLVRYKTQIYLTNICQLIAEYLQNSQLFSPQIQTYVTEILQESDKLSIFSLFENMCKQINQETKNNQIQT